MRIFDSQKNTRWKGEGFMAKSNSITISKVARFSQNIDLRPGEYTIRVVGRKKSGVGGLIFKIAKQDGSVLSESKIDFVSSSFSEQSFKFKLAEDFIKSSLSLIREEKASGTIEVSSLVIDFILEESKIRIASKLLPKNIVNQNIYDNSTPPAHSQLDLEQVSMSKPAKIAFVIPYGIYGGAEVYVKNIVNNLPPIISVNLLYLHDNEIKNNITNPACSHYNFVSHQDFISNLQEQSYDYIVYYNRLDVYNILSSLVSNKTIKAKLIEIYHSDFVWPGSLSSHKERTSIWKFISISPSLAGTIYGISHLTSIITVGIDTSLFSKSNQSELKSNLGLGDKKIIGTVARLSREKNLDKVLDIAKEMPNYHFLIIGEGPERQHLERRIMVEKINNLTLLGYISDVHKYYNIFDAFLLTSKIEGTPISIIESMASEVPVFSTEVGSIGDLIIDGITGFFIEDALGAKNIIEENINDKSVVYNARNHVVENYNIKNNTNKFISILDSAFYENNKVNNHFFFRDGIEAKDIRVFNKIRAKPFKMWGKVSIIINNYNKGDLLRKSVKSALAQDYRDIEVIVVDDQSNDDPIEILKGIDDPRLIIYKNKKNCGAYACRNFAMEIAKGNYITFLDSDDTILIDHIKHLVNGLENLNLKAVNSKYVRLDAKGKFIASSICEPGIIFKKDILKEVGYFHMVRFRADSEFRQRLMKVYGNEKVKVIDYCSYIALKTEKSLTTTPETRCGSPISEDYISKFESNKSLYYHYNRSMSFLNLQKEILSIPLDFNNFTKLK